MPADFDRCVKAGGRVRTKKLSGGKYMHICFKDGKSYAGEVKKKESFTWTADFIIEDFKPEELEMMDKGHAFMHKDMIAKGKKMKGALLRKESRNGRVYEFDAMIKAKNEAQLPLPVSMNHGDDVSDNVALITKLIPTGDGLDYEGIVFNTAKYPDAIEMMEKQLINKISIEADNPYQEEREGKVIIKSFDLMGAGFVKYAGIPQASASIAEALEKTKIEVDQMEDNTELLELKARLEAREKELDLVKLAEAEKKRLEEEAKKKQVEESIAALQSEVKALKEMKKSGIITGNDQDTPYQIAEKLDRTLNEKTLVFEKRGSDKSSFYAAHPEEFY